MYNYLNLLLLVGQHIHYLSQPQICGANFESCRSEFVRSTSSARRSRASEQIRPGLVGSVHSTSKITSHLNSLECYEHST